MWRGAARAATPPCEVLGVLWVPATAQCPPPRLGLTWEPAAPGQPPAHAQGEQHAQVPAHGRRAHFAAGRAAAGCGREPTTAARGALQLLPPRSRSGSRQPRPATDELTGARSLALGLWGRGFALGWPISARRRPAGVGAGPRATPSLGVGGRWGVGAWVHGLGRARLARSGSLPRTFSPLRSSTQGDYPSGHSAQCPADTLEGEEGACPRFSEVETARWLPFVAKEAQPCKRVCAPFSTVLLSTYCVPGAGTAAWQVIEGGIGKIMLNGVYKTK